jgi:hypothetical protein
MCVCLLTIVDALPRFHTPDSIPRRLPRPRSPFPRYHAKVDFYVRDSRRSARKPGTSTAHTLLHCTVRCGTVSYARLVRVLLLLGVAVLVVVVVVFGIRSFGHWPSMTLRDSAYLSRRRTTRSVRTTNNTFLSLHTHTHTSSKIPLNRWSILSLSRLSYLH